ncbi:proprotein convertase P-domain-containing protein [Streptomyces sp. 135]|uniref:proprotein convertase P-domain-containing protein n=1 Tax=Streptomyces sp. 135 TaxID=2838850 RepID=UPI001CBDA081|nr:proprotein convertase P-domain-containing protein [Streptomyces sp. 135]
MNRRTGTALTALGVVFAVTASVLPAGGAGAAALPPERELRQVVGDAMQDRLGAQARSGYGLAASAKLEILVEPQRWSANRGWTFGSSVFLIPRGVETAPVVSLFVARRTGSTWQVGLQGTPAFAALSHRAPSQVVKDAERAPFARTASPEPRAATGLSLPWQRNAGWAHWGVHGNSGASRPYNSIDFYGGDGNVRASRAGLMYRHCTSGGRWPHITVMHDNGYTTGYYHLRDTTGKPSGSAVAHGEYLGRIAEELPCGGSANGDHTHWTLWTGSDGNTPVAVRGKEIGGWTWYEGASPYQGYAERGSTRIHRNQCCDLINYGGGGDPGTFFENTSDLDIPDQGQAESSITVGGISGNAPASLSVFQDVHHTWRGDLRIDLIGPSGTAYRLRSPDPDDDSDVIHETDTVDASAETANGVWKLRVTDTSVNDSGHIDAWSLTF